ncbi:hypothetical protein [Sporosarcina sp. OR05]|uniref:hypothetical protein n=1 Tax=Sporosarcina sp. OR05 TaxID=2969819 RepID=UPI00352AF2C1
MNTHADILTIIEEYYTQTGLQILTTKRDDDVKQAAKEAEARFMEGLEKLEGLKLSAYNRRHFNLLREAFCDIIKSMREIRRDNGAKAEMYSQSAGRKFMRYTRAWGGA